MNSVKSSSLAAAPGALQIARLAIETQGTVLIDRLRLLSKLGEVPAVARAVVPDADPGAVGYLRAAVGLAGGVQPAGVQPERRARG